jgi:hypothetical protein
MEGQFLLLMSSLSSRLRIPRSITEVLVLSDAIRVKQQKPTRQRSRREAAPEKKRETVKVNTDIRLMECADGGFEYLTADISESGDELVSIEDRKA